MLNGCQDSARVKDTASAGAGIGAGVGFLIGVLSGDPEKAVAGLAVGAAVGASEGAYEGWRQEQDDARTLHLAKAIKESGSSAGQQDVSASDRAREELTRFIGIWDMEGWMQEPGEKRITVKAKVNADVEMSYFVELAYIDMQVPGHDKQIWGSSMLGYDDGEGYNITSRFNTLSEPIRLSGGKYDSSTRTFTFSEPDMKVSIRFESPDRFITETFISSGENQQKVESYRFTRKYD